MLTRVGLYPRKDHRPTELSGGEQQRVAIARALVNQPRILLADEPTGNLDSITSREIVQTLADLNGNQGVTVIMISHEELLLKETRPRSYPPARRPGCRTAKIQVRFLPLSSQRTPSCLNFTFALRAQRSLRLGKVK